MNFITECIDQIKSLDIVALRRDPAFVNDVHNLSNVIQDLSIAKKFLLPPPNLLNVKATAPALKFMKLPAPICAFEYEFPDARSEGIKGNVIPTSKSSKRIALAYDCSSDAGPIKSLKDQGQLDRDATGILVISLYYLDKLKMWTVSQGMGYISEKVVAEGGAASEMLFDNVNIRAFVEVYSLLPDMIQLTIGHLNENQRIAALLNDVAEELSTAVRATLLLSSKNLKEFQIVEAPKQLNRKRVQRDKTPFFDYWSIDIFFKGTPHYDRKNLDYQKIRSLLLRNRSHLTSEYRTVTGHLKVRSTGVFFWSEHERLTKVKG